MIKLKECLARDAEESTTIQTAQTETTEDMVNFLLGSTQKSTKNGKPTSLILEKAHTTIPAHIIADAISTYRGAGLRWSMPSSPGEMRYVEQYVLAKYPEYSKALAEGKNKLDLYDLCIKEDYAMPSPEEKQKPPRGVFRNTLRSNFDYLERTHLVPSRLLDILTKKSMYAGSFVSIPEIQARNKVLERCGLPAEEYLVIFTSSYKDTMMLVGESYPFFRGNYYMTAIDQESDHIRAFTSNKDSKAIIVPPTWLDLRIRGSQLSQYIRRKSHHSPKGLFSYPLNVDEIPCSRHWISEAHKNSWHVLLDATTTVMGEGQLNLGLHRPDFLLCSPANVKNGNARITCLLVRRKSFETTTLDPQGS